MKYKIGHIASQFGIHPQTIRFYEKEKLLISEVSQCSTTRYYFARDFKRLASIRRYLQLGFGTREVRKLFDHERPEDIAAQVSAKKQETFQRLQELTRTLWALDHYEAGLSLIDRLLGRCEMAKRPAMLLFINQTGQELDFSDEMLSQLRKWSSHLDLVSNASLVPASAFDSPSGSHSRQSGFCIEEEIARRFGFYPEGRMVQRIESKVCLHTVSLLAAPDERNTMALFEPAINYMRENGLRSDGDALGRILTVIQEGHTPTDHRPRAVYYEYFIPVAPHNAEI